MKSSSIDDRSASDRSMLVGEEAFLTLTKVEIVAEKQERDFLDKNFDVKRNWEKLQFNNGLRPYLLTATPTNSTYDATFSSSGGLAEVFKFLKNYWGIKQAFGTTEKLDVSKVHHHIIVWHTDLNEKFEQYPNKDKTDNALIIGGKHRFGLHIQPIDRLTSAYEYITKECRKRLFVKLSDYRILLNWTQEELDTFKGSKRKNANLVLRPKKLGLKDNDSQKR